MKGPGHTERQMGQKDRGKRRDRLDRERETKWSKVVKMGKDFRQLWVDMDKMIENETSK